MAQAYGVHAIQVEGPRSLDENWYDIMAVVPSGSTKDQVPTMLRNLLARRFNMIVHHETKLLPFSELTIAKGGAKLNPAVHSVIPPTEGLGGITGLGLVNGVYQLAPGSRRAVMVEISQGLFHMMVSSLTMTEFADKLTKWGTLGGPVVDETGLVDMYDFGFDFSADQPSTDDPGAPSTDVPTLTVVLQNQLGLSVKTTKKAQDIIIVDRADKVPTSN